jgi:uncharacterized SAM-binding protein YcdF (DUF218 family)
MSGFWGRATLAAGLAIYAWTMMGLQLYLRVEDHGGPLLEFRRLTMGRAVIGLGAAAVLAAIILALLGYRRRRGPALLALALSAAWIVCLVAIWPI